MWNYLNVSKQSLVPLKRDFYITMKHIIAFLHLQWHTSSKMFHLHVVLQQHVSPKPWKYGLFDAELEMLFGNALIFFFFFLRVNDDVVKLAVTFYLKLKPWWYFPSVLLDTICIKTAMLAVTDAFTVIANC